MRQMPAAYASRNAPKSGPAIAFAVPESRSPKSTKPVSFPPRRNGFRKFDSARTPNRTANVVRAGPLRGTRKLLLQLHGPGHREAPGSREVGCIRPASAPCQCKSPAGIRGAAPGSLEGSTAARPSRQRAGVGGEALRGARPGNARGIGYPRAVPQQLTDLPTPALCVDVDALQVNLRTMASFFRGGPCALRPHVKAHKTPAIARLQAAAGCAGFTCATVGEAEVLARHRFDDLLIANEILDPSKVGRLRALAGRARLTVAIDSAAGAALLADLPIGALVDVNVGLPRCGVLPENAVDVARAIARTRLRLRGVMGYEGHAMGMQEPTARAEAARGAMAILLQVADDLRTAGFEVPVVSAGGTGTYDVTGRIPGVTEVQAGSYALMDTAYARFGLPFVEALRCLTTVLTVQGAIAVLDAGLKTLAVDHGNPELPPDVPARVLFLCDEHTTLLIEDGFRARPGDRMWLRPSHVDPTVNLHDRLFAIRGEEVMDVWPVEARGY